ncbi:alpha/beta hydrolase fold protein [Gracilibacillus halophilus YIM-C55.5]|uniref:Alpha/beta hydrolase fold protein n=1 Tax=Gracilibacillus halophilus YIM-C55.5 TaxID=1308866 RepID=N4WRW1_9BACI|nr:alpha/beta hydrolase fold protein [Gracilibacillus halophilus YIM-C55.5]
MMLPVCLLVGEWDEKFVSLAKKMDERLPNSQVKQVKQSGHAIHVEQAQIFGIIVMNTIKQTGGKTNDSRMDK